MCRMLVAVGDFSTVALIEGFRRMAKDENALHEYNEGRHGEFRHTEGWGMTYLKDGTLKTVHGMTPCWEDGALDDLADVRSSLVVLHARKSTRGVHAPENLHPFPATHPALGPLVFCHNGSVDGIEVPDGVELRGDTDTERFMHALLAALGPEDPERGIARYIGSLTDLTGANCILATAHAAYVTTRCTERPRYYTMHRLDDARGTVISSEPLALLGENWQPVPFGETVLLPVPEKTLPIRT